MGRARALVAAALGTLVVVAVACGGSSAPPTTTTTTATTTPPAALEAGKEICQGFYSDLVGSDLPIDFRSRVERAKQAGPQLGQIFEGLVQLSVEKKAGSTPIPELEDRTKTLLVSLQVVCQDEYGVAPPTVPAPGPAQSTPPTTAPTSAPPPAP